jgi:hypothetical protein
VHAAEIDGLQIRALREGRFLFDFSNSAGYEDQPESQQFDELTAIAVRRAELMNSHVLSLHVALRRRQRLALQKPVVSPLQFVSHDALDSTSYAWTDQRLTPLLTADSLASYNQLSPNTHDWRLSTRTNIDLATVDEAVEILCEIVSHPLPMLAIADLYLRSAAFYESHDYNLALVSSWAIVETLLQAQWRQYLDANCTREIGGVDVSFINAERRQRLVSGRDYTASVISETLSLVGSLPHETYLKLDKVRRDRNAFLHELTAVPRAAADRALSVAETMLVDVAELDLTVPRLSFLGG